MHSGHLTHAGDAHSLRLCAVVTMIEVLGCVCFYGCGCGRLLGSAVVQCGRGLYHTYLTHKRVVG